ncbi:Mu transposase C-terminal domain-containing protein [Pantanalinema sp. GBBB05]|uniref:Mu transposase C-terminal domain-containing protein n=1 Tax=Pantanalinema sp. GBBB05 TaxID=2604139 RepID=UPI003D8195EA
MQPSDLSLDNPDFASNEIIAEVISAEAKLKLEVIQKLIEPCDRKTYGERLKAAAEKLNCNVRTVQRLVKKWEDEGLAALAQDGRRDKGTHRISEEWQKFIVAVYKKGKCTPTQIAVQVKTKAKAEGQDNYPSHMTVYRVLAPYIEKQEQSSNIRNIGWRGSRLALKTRDGDELAVEYSNQVWQCDHTRADILLVDKHGVLLTRPWLTTVIDTYSRCIVGFNLGFDAPSSKVVAVALRHAILPKKYSSEYKLYVDWSAYGTPEHLFTDGGKDFRSEHLQQIGVQLGFTCHLRDRPSEGGIVERPFGTFNTEFFSTLPGYTGSNVQERPAEAEKEASLTLRELEQLFVAYLVNRYNRGLDARMGNQTRMERWEAGLLKQPIEIPERHLDICLMKQTRRTIYRSGYLQFENLTYQSDDLVAYAGEAVVLRYDPRDITTVLVYRQQVEREKSDYPLAESEQPLKWIKEVFLGSAQIQDLEGEKISLDEARDMSRSIREAGKAVNHNSMLDEARDREAFLEQKKKTRRDRQKEEQATIRPPHSPIKSIDSTETQPSSSPVKSSDSDITQSLTSTESKVEIPVFEIWDFDEE